MPGVSQTETRMPLTCCFVGFVSFTFTVNCDAIAALFGAVSSARSG